VDDDTTELGRCIREAREAAHLSIRQAAELAGLHYSFWSRIESGDRRKIDPKDVQRIAEVLKIDSSELLEFIGVKPSLPEPVVYFRRAYGMNEHEATEAAEIIENLRAHQREQQNKKGENNENTD
jgi:transcriptional regulator with XRE-family HTH domain